MKLKKKKLQQFEYKIINYYQQQNKQLFITIITK